MGQWVHNQAFIQYAIHCRISTTKANSWHVRSTEYMNQHIPNTPVGPGGTLPATKIPRAIPLIIREGPVWSWRIWTKPRGWELISLKNYIYLLCVGYGSTKVGMWKSEDNL